MILGLVFSYLGLGVGFLVFLMKIDASWTAMLRDYFETDRFAVVYSLIILMLAWPYFLIVAIIRVVQDIRKS